MGGRLGLTLWLHLDPRDAVSHFLEQYPHARQKNIVCLEIALENDRFETTYDYSRPATDHKQVDVAHTFDGIERVFACQIQTRTGLAESIAARIFSREGYWLLGDRPSETAEIDSTSVVDISPAMQSTDDAASKSVLVSGAWNPPSPGQWRALAFIRFGMETFDCAGQEAAAFQNKLIDIYREALGDDLDGIISDEPGAPCRYHILTLENGFMTSDRFYEMFQSACGYDLRDRLYQLVYETSDGQAGRTRCDYYGCFGRAVFDLQKQLKDYSISRFGSHLRVGIHCTAADWSAMDLQRGTLDYWKMTETTTDGFTDGKHHDRYNGFFHVILAKSLAKLSDSGRGYTQTWGNFPTAVSESYWSGVASIYGLGWYPLGYRKGYFVDQMMKIAKKTFQEHWENFRRINSNMDRIIADTEGVTADANVLAVFPLETIARLGNEEANALRRVSHKLAYQLHAAHFQTDFTSAAMLASAKVKDGKIQLKGCSYDVLVCPFPGCIPLETYQQIENFYKQGGKILIFGSPPSETPQAEDLCPKFSKLAGIRPLTRMRDYFNPDPSTPYSGTISFTAELSGMPSLNIREGMYVSIPWHHYFWPVDPVEASPVAFNVRWEAEPNWLGCLNRNPSGGKLLFLGFDCTNFVDGDQLFDDLLQCLDVPKLV